MKETNSTSSKVLSQVIVEGMQDKKALNISILDLRKIPQAVADFFVICSATSVNQAEAIAKSVEEKVYKNKGEDPWQSEGKQNREWILLDYIDVVVHIFTNEKRDFYALEDLWGDAEIERVQNPENLSKVNNQY